VKVLLWLISNEKQVKDIVKLINIQIEDPVCEQQNIISFGVE